MASTPPVFDRLSCAGEHVRPDFETALELNLRLLGAADRGEGRRGAFCAAGDGL